MLPLMMRMYRAESVADGPTAPATMRLVYARGQQPGVLAARRPELPDGVPRPPRPPRVDLFVDGVAFPSALQFAPDGRLFFNEVRDGRVRIASPTGRLQPEPFVVLPVAPGLEQGALGLALDPDFAENHWVYVFYSEADAEGRPVRNRVVRFTERDGRATEATAILDTLPINPTSSFVGGHNSGRLAFGPDGKLYVSIGEMGQRDRVPDRTSLYGKILRLNRDGSVPADNPDGQIPTFALGFRNVVGLAFHPGTGQLYVADGGSGGFDELNQVRAGRDYGFPWIDGGPDGVSGLEDPMWDSAEDRLGISGLTIYTGSLFPEYAGDLFFCSYNTGALRRVRLAGATLERVEWMETVARDCRLDVTNGPDGTLYLSDLSRIFRLVR
jgi:glucose/arabinose dehydrogenase